jgi:hypothetical protein
MVFKQISDDPWSSDSLWLPNQQEKALRLQKFMLLAYCLPHLPAADKDLKTLTNLELEALLLQGDWPTC